MKSHYVYLAIGLDKSYLSWLYKFNMPILQLYIGVRTGNLPDNGYKTSSKNKQWLYLCKYSLAIFETRPKANDAELALLKACLQAGAWPLLANKAIGKMPCQLGSPPWNKGQHLSAETKAKQSQSAMGKAPTRLGAKHSDASIEKCKQNSNERRDCIARYDAIMPFKLANAGHSIVFYYGADLYSFVKQNKLYNFSKVLKGDRIHCHGWRLANA